MINKKIKTNSGFIALMSAIIISVILLLIATNLSLTGFYGRSNILDYELKERSSALAEACVDTALLKLANNPSYGGSEFVNVDKVGGNDCTIKPVVGDIIQVQGYYNNIYFTNLEIEFDPSDISVTRWEEKPN